MRSRYEGVCGGGSVEGVCGGGMQRGYAEGVCGGSTMEGVPLPIATIDLVGDNREFEV